MEIDSAKQTLRIVRRSDNAELLTNDAETDIWRVNTGLFFVKKAGNEILALRMPPTASEAGLVEQLVQHRTKRSLSEFSQKTEEASAESYFHYYGMLQHQQNMLQDFIRTGSYYAAITENRQDFEGKTVMDVGAGSGILSLFAAQAGAAKVYAVEASDMAIHAEHLAKLNPGFGDKVEVVKGRLEELSLTAEVDVLISEPMGTLLVNERMLETYLYARKHYLKPGGKMFPSLGRIYAAAFSDETLYAELVNKAAFWLQGNFYGVNVAGLHGDALSGYFSQVVVDAIDPAVLVSRSTSKIFDFSTIADTDLDDICIPLDLCISTTCSVHGVATWFDVLFDGTTSQRWLSTAPGQPTTHWFQLRCVLQQPIAVTAGQHITGELRLKAHQRQSYDVFLSLTGPPLAPGRPPQTASGCLDLKDPFYRQLLTPQA